MLKYMLMEGGLDSQLSARWRANMLLRSKTCGPTLNAQLTVQTAVMTAFSLTLLNRLREP